MVHAHAIKIGYGLHESVNTKLLQMYRRCGCLQDAKLLFNKMPIRNLFAWTTIIGVHLDHGLFNDAVSVFGELLLQDVALDPFVFSSVFKVCSGLDMLELGWQLHGMVIKFGFHLDVSVGNALIDTYGKCGSLEDAVKVLEMMPDPDNITWNSVITACAANGMVHKSLSFLQKMQNSDHLKPDLVSWSAVIGGFAQNGFDEEAIDLLSRMQAEGLQPNSRTVASVLPACARLGRNRLGKELHGYIVRHGFMANTYVVNGLVNVYRRCSDMGSAHKIFSKFAEKTKVSYNTMIAGYCENGVVSKAMQLFNEMELQGVHRSLISWNSMIAGYVDNLQYLEGLSLFKDFMTLERIAAPDSYTLGSALTACANMSCLRKGKEIHSIAIGRGLQSDAFVGAALVDMYCSCEDIVAAQLAFDEVIDKDITTWNALIFGYATLNDSDKVRVLIQQMKEDGHEPNSYTWNGILECHLQNGNLDLATQVLSEMHSSKFIPDVYTIGLLLGDCSKLATLERGKQIHGLSIRRGYDSDLHIGTVVVDMYAKCGSIKNAMAAYNRILEPNLVTHNAMLTAYAMHGYGEQGISLFQKILETGYRPDEVTFLSTLCSCVHAGTVEMGRLLFGMMENCGMKPTLKHFTAMVDLLSRSGKLEEAYEMIQRMPMVPDSILWGALLGGCVIHGNVEMGEIAARNLFELEPEESGNYVMLANLYAYSRRWSDLNRTRNVVKERGLHKSPGYSWIEDRDEVHTFLACDISHKRADEIYVALDTLALHMKTNLLL
ncbi:Pentatricopeptide repeat-containing protein At2g13600 [Linum perenne]